MAYWIIAGVLLVALAPLQHFWPSKRQRRLANLREHAAISGLYVELRKLPIHRKVQIHIPADDARFWVFYGLRVSPKKTPSVGSWIRRNAEWFQLTGDGELPEPLKRLPDGCDIVSITPGSLGFFWAEQGDCNTIDVAFDCLKTAALD